MRADEPGRERARPDHDHAGGVRAGEITGGEGRGGGRAPKGQARAVENGERHARGAVHEEIGAEDARQPARAVVGKHGDDLGADETVAIGGAGPGRHEQQRPAGAGPLDIVMVAARHDDIGAEGLGERVDESRKGERAVDLVGRDDAHRRQPVRNARRPIPEGSRASVLPETGRARTVSARRRRASRL